jgi:hypothetical protein
MLLKWEPGLHATNDAIQIGKMTAISEWLDEHTKPKAAYFGTENGKRTAYIFFDLEDPAQIPVIAEPLFQRLESTVEFIPVMNAEDLQRGLANIARD